MQGVRFLSEFYGCSVQFPHTCPANLTVLNATRQHSRVVTAERHSKVTLACWTWCGYVDWDSIMLSGRGLYNGRSAQFSCKGTDGPCERLRVAPTCDHVNTAQDDILKYELSVVVNETFYIECQPHCTYEGADKNIGRTNGFLIHVIGKRIVAVRTLFSLYTTIFLVFVKYVTRCML